MMKMSLMTMMRWLKQYDSMCKAKKILFKVIEKVRNGTGELEFVIEQGSHLVFKPIHEGYMNQYVFDVVVPVYNGFEYLETLLRTIENAGAAYRLILIDDCSSDERVCPVCGSISKTIQMQF